jgi:hypothetical protein
VIGATFNFIGPACEWRATSCSDNHRGANL